MELDSNMRNRLWTELTNAKFNSIYADLFATKQRKKFWRVNLFITIFSSTGIVGWSIWKPYTLIITVLLTFISLIQTIGSTILPTNDKMDSMNKVINFYNCYFNQLEDLWFKYNRYLIDTETMQTLFYKIKDSERDINPIVDIIIGNKIDKKLQKEAEKLANIYISKHY